MAESPPKVLSIVWNLIRGGTEGQCARVAMGLAAQGHTHRVAVFRREGFFLEAVERASGPVYEVEIDRMFTWQTHQAIQRLAAYIREEAFDLVHLWDIDAVIFGSMAARKAGVPYITSRRDMAEIYPPHKLFLMRQADRRAAAIVANATAIKTMLAKEGRKNIQVLPNVLDLDEFDQMQGDFPALDHSDYPDLAGRILVGMIARLDMEKDGHTFLRGIAEARKKDPRIIGIIAGDGEERNKLEHFSGEVGSRDALIFLGEVSDVPSLIRRLDIGVLVPKSNEGLSNTILEYMAGGLPVVATDCGGNGELVTPETGRLIPVGDHEALAAELVALAADDALRRELGRAGRAFIEDRHRPESVCTAVEALYREVATGR